jgi:hypothetical protein
LAGRSTSVAIGVAGAVDLDDGAGLGAVDGLLGDGLVAVRVEALALGRVGLDAHARERAEQLVFTRADAVVRWWSRSRAAPRRRQRALEVVERGQQLAREAEDAARSAARTSRRARLRTV